MKRTLSTILAIFLVSFFSQSQNYTSYFTGNSADLVTQPTGGICLMGGASEHDEAMKWFLQQSNGGDVLVIRATGSNGYNDYMFNQLGITINSVETIVFNNANASSDAYVIDKIKKAEAIWIAGGDQWTYTSYWRNTAVDSLINKGISERNIVIGGTSAGMAIQGSHYFSAETGTVTSAQALNNPYNSLMTVSNEPFIVNQHLTNVITDTHYDNPDRKGRHVAFIARALQDEQTQIRGIACNEYTAVCIDANGICRVYGDYPNYPEHAYFIQANCEIVNNVPEVCLASTPLTWNQGGAALKVYKANGTNNGSQTFDLNDWKTGTGGTWEDWSVNNGVLTQVASTEASCSISGLSSLENDWNIYPIPVTGDVLNIEGYTTEVIRLYDAFGKEQMVDINNNQINCSNLENGIYFLLINNLEIQKIIIKK
ncbi:MAG: Type 1 glutamine amidotransferase-like domain-containing protein [Crocinitomicaceae bacterium]|nr:Type 1 glutamine amidotransferase-like domain-containing protein [Crocinitomicaceae bacterium]MCF8433395.1 Type 1 glutamine amidotransferase-like domain-containing protein [Crocinitomicaceae bacterium]